MTGASSGTGQACAEAIAAAGHKVYGSSRKASFRPAKCQSLQMNVTSDASVQAAVESVLQREDRIEVAINNAGYGLAGPVEETSIPEAQAQMDAKFSALFA